MPVSGFQRAMRLINRGNRSWLTSTIISSIKSIMRGSPTNVSESWRYLGELGSSLANAVKTSPNTIPSLVQDIKVVAVGLVPEAEMAVRGPDMFVEAEERERQEVDKALPPDLVVPGEVIDEPGAIDEEMVVTAAKKPDLLKGIQALVAKCDAFLSFRPESSATRKDVIRRYYEAGVEGLNWYDNVNTLLTKYFGKDNARTFARLLAATSPRMPVERNLTTAIQAFNYYANEFKAKNRISKDKDVSLADDPNFRGRMANYFMRTHVPNIGRAMSGKDLSGSKVDNFQKALSGDPDAVTLDVWMGRAFGIQGNLFDDPSSYEVISEAIRELAAEAGVEPRQYQAAVWTGIKKEQGKRGQTASSFDSLMGNFWDDFAMKCFKPGVKAPKSTRYPLFETAAWISSNCRFCFS